MSDVAAAIMDAAERRLGRKEFQRPLSFPDQGESRGSRHSALYRTDGGSDRTRAPEGAKPGEGLGESVPRDLALRGSHVSMRRPRCIIHGSAAGSIGGSEEVLQDVPREARAGGPLVG